MKATLVVVSATASLEQMQRALGKSRLEHHALGSFRTSGLMRKQSIWMRDWSLETERAEDMVMEMLDWLERRLPAITAIDSSAFIKIVCAIPHASDTFAVDPRMAKALADTGAMLLINASDGGA